MAGPVIIGSLARELRTTRGDLRMVHARIDTFLEGLFPGWRPRYPIELGWRFADSGGGDDPGVLDVFEVIDSPAGRRALALSGFPVATLHPHEASKFLSCTCKPQRTEPT